MARPKFKVTQDNYTDAREYLSSQVRNNQHSLTIGAVMDWEKLPHSLDRTKTADCASRVNAWCEMHLDSSQWTKLKNALRARRKRQSDGCKGDNKVTVTLSRSAWIKLSSVADTHNVTMSQAIEKYLRSSPP